MIIKRTCKSCGKKLTKASKYDFCYSCRMKLNRKPDKFCKRCGVKISNRSTKDYCKDCMHIIQHTKFCNCCKNESYFTNIHNVACDKCLHAFKKFPSDKYKEHQILVTNLIEQIYQYTDLADFIFKILFNKNNLEQIETNSLTKYDKVREKNLYHINTVIHDLCDHITKIKNWSLNDNNLVVSILNGMLKKQSGYYLDLSKTNLYSYKKNLDAIFSPWRIDYYQWDKARLFIECLINFKASQNAGPGEFFLSLILNDNCIYNDSKQGDICTKLNKYEVKEAVDQNKSGRLLFNRNNWFMISSQNIDEVKHKLINYFNITDKYISEQLNDVINKTDIYNFNLNPYGLFNSFYKAYINSQDNENTKNFILFCMKNFIFTNNKFEFRLTDEVNFLDENEVNIFFLINYLKYYLDCDTNGNIEGLTMFTFVSFNGIFNITVDDIYHSSLEKLINIIGDKENILISHPSIIETKKSQIIHDRNKAFTPGIIVNVK